VQINAEKLKTLAKQAGLDKEALAAAIVRPGLDGEDAGSAVSNWMASRNHPRAKPEDIRKLATALGCEMRDITRFVTIARYQRSSPRKARLLADMIRGRRVDEALDALSFSKRRAAMMVSKVLKTAIADAEQHDANIEALVVTESCVNEGPIIKRFRPKDRGRAHPIQKKTSHIVIGVEEAA